MAEEISRVDEPSLNDDPQDDVVGKIDQLLNRHRPKAPAVEAIPVLTNAPQDENDCVDDGIPVLTDAVARHGQPARILPPRKRLSSTESALLLQRMEIALDAEHIRQLAQIDRDDAEKARMLDRLVAELKRVLPGIVTAVTGNGPAESP